MPYSCPYGDRKARKMFSAGAIGMQAPSDDEKCYLRGKVTSVSLSSPYWPPPTLTPSLFLWFPFLHLCSIEVPPNFGRGQGVGVAVGVGVGVGVGGGRCSSRNGSWLSILHKHWRWPGQVTHMRHAWLSAAVAVAVVASQSHYSGPCTRIPAALASPAPPHVISVVEWRPLLDVHSTLIVSCGACHMHAKLYLHSIWILYAAML